MCYSNNWKWNKKTKGLISCYVVGYLRDKFITNLLANKEVTKIKTQGVIQIRKGTIRAFLEPLQPLTNIGILRYYQMNKYLMMFIQ